MFWWTTSSKLEFSWRRLITRWEEKNWKRTRQCFSINFSQGLTWSWMNWPKYLQLGWLSMTYSLILNFTSYYLLFNLGSLQHTFKRTHVTPRLYSLLQKLELYQAKIILRWFIDTSLLWINCWVQRFDSDVSRVFWWRICFLSFTRRVDASVAEMGKLLYEVRGGGQGQAIPKSEVSAAADAILQPLMDLLDGITSYESF